MRPKSIVYFELTMFGTLGLGFIQSAIAWIRVSNLTKPNENPVISYLATFLITFLILTILILLVSRFRNRIAKWISIIFFFLGIPVLAFQISRGLFFGSQLIASVQLICQFFGYSLLFTPSARHWMMRDGQNRDEQTAAAFE